MNTDQNVPEWGKELIKGFAYSKKYDIKSRIEAKRDELCSEQQ